MAMKEIAVLGDPQTCELLRRAMSKQSLLALNTDEMEIQDEWSVRRWMARNTPDGVFVCVGLQGQTTVANFLLTTVGSLNAIRAALGNVKRLALVSQFPSAEFFLLERFVNLLQWEKKVDFYSLVPGKREELSAFADRCVLSMNDVSAEKADAQSTQGPEQGREVRGQVLPQPEGDQQHGATAQPVLEVPVEATKGAAPGDVCAQCSPPASQAAGHPHNHNPGAI
jgi:hypothetical protein